MGAGIASARSRLRRSAAAVGLWPLWQLPSPLVAYLFTVIGLAAATAVVSVVRTPVRPTELATWAVLLACAGVSVEAARRSGEPAGMSRDLLAAWTLPIALLLPPVYALLAPIPLTVVTQLRVRRSPPYRRVFSAAVVGLVGFGRSWLFHRLVGPMSGGGHGGARAGLLLATALACGLVFAQLNSVLVAAAVHLHSPEVGWRKLLWQRESVVLDLGELSIGVLIAVGWLFSPVAVLVALPPMVLLHRSLTHQQLQAAARIDAKTGLLNAGAWQQEAERELSRATRHRRPLAVIIADLDHFKRVNDAYGHLTGDRVLAATATALRAAVRRYDSLGRFGGEEFVVLLPDTDPTEAHRVAERLRSQVAAAAVSVEDSAMVQVTVSVGVAMLGANGTALTELLAAADLALYRAKSAGRNRVTFAPGATVTTPPTRRPEIPRSDSPGAGRR
jgi:diguanylate cyclase (GGDEF)-like protein